MARVKPKNLGKALQSIIGDFDANTTAKANKAARAATIAVWGDIITETPVDTGEVRNAWLIGQRVSDSIGSGNKDANYVQANLPTDILKDKLYLFNNKPYAVMLEFGGYNGPTDKVTSRGFSKLAPQGMVRRNMKRWPTIFNQAYKSL